MITEVEFTHTWVVTRVVSKTEDVEVKAVSEGDALKAAYESYDWQEVEEESTEYSVSLKKLT